MNIFLRNNANEVVSCYNNFKFEVQQTKSNVADFFLNVEEQAYDYVQSLQRVTAETIGLDARAGRYIYIAENVIVVDDCNIFKLNYYGNFECVHANNIKVIGQFTFYFVDKNDNDCRVRACLEFAKIRYIASM